MRVVSTRTVPEARRDVFGFGAFGDGELDLGEDGFVGDGGDVIGKAAFQRSGERFVVEEHFAAEVGEEGFDFAGGEQVGDDVAEVGEGGIVESVAGILGDGFDEAETFLGSGSGKERNFEVDAAGAFEIDFDEVGAAGGENPDDAAAVFLVAHFLGEHGVNATGDGGFAAAGIAPAERLVRFVDENVAFADAFDGAENSFEIALGAAVPFVAKVFEDDDGDVGFAGEAADQKSFAGADGAADEVTHRDEIELLLAPESDVLAEMLLECVLSVDMVELEFRWEKFDEVGAFALDELRFGLRQIGGINRVALMFLELEEIQDAEKSRAGELAGRVRDLVFDLGESGGVEGRSGGEKTFDIGWAWEWDVHLGGMGVLPEERMQVAGVLGEDEGGHIVPGEERFAAPFADEESDGVGFAGGVVREELGVLEDDSDLEPLVCGGGIVAGDGGEVRGVAEVNGDEFDGGARVASGGSSALIPLGEEFGAAFDAQAVADVVAENDVVARDDAVGDELGKGPEIGFVVGREEVVGIAGDDELVAGMAVVEVDDAGDPGGGAGVGGCVL